MTQRGRSEGRIIPLYSESYRLLTAPGAIFGDRAADVEDVRQVPLGLLPPDMQNRRIIAAPGRFGCVAETPTRAESSCLSYTAI